MERYMNGYHGQDSFLNMVHKHMPH
jgi:hypothetical protein